MNCIQRGLTGLIRIRKFWTMPIFMHLTMLALQIYPS